ncbi:hypothetical protein ARMSODRAFT_972665 [Armillaria solidipes]|uniref:Uncharacterized protein n=1 Tax=Armillaria solidipes TaxID=1076256 RepID=A0A2H3CAI9_9AGAR|nr:hypothetical protein ARMSODRAFT_972665 [Armillaria solidipes]
MHPSASAESSHRPPRPPSSASRRQPSSRPVSSLSTRLPTSASTVVPRPASSASVQPHSRLTQRPQSRLARANHQRLTELCEDLVRGVIGDVDQNKFREQVAYAARSLSAEGMTLNKAGIVLGEAEVDRMIHTFRKRESSPEMLSQTLFKYLAGC